MENVDPKKNSGRRRQFGEEKDDLAGEEEEHGKKNRARSGWRRGRIRKRINAGKKNCGTQVLKTRVLCGFFSTLNAIIAT